MENTGASNIIAKWVIESRPLEVIFERKASIKGQILADFIAEFTSGPHLRILL